MTKFFSVTWVLFNLIISPCLLSTAANAQITEPDFFHIDLRKVTNMEFYDQTADDQKGGWIDMGPTHSFEAVPYGVFTFQDGIIPFNIINYQ